MAGKIIFTLVRGLCAYALLLLFGRLIGRKMISRITTYDFLVGVTLGSLAVRISLGSDNSFVLSMLATAEITLLVLVTDRLSLSSLRFRSLLEGGPVVVVEGGLILGENLRRARLSAAKLLMLLREKNAFDLSDVQLAVLENDGELSVVLRAQKLPATRGDMGKDGGEAKMPVDLIIDGRVLTGNFKGSGRDAAWLRGELSKSGLDERDVVYAGLDTGGNLLVSPGKNKN